MTVTVLPRDPKDQLVACGLSATRVFWIAVSLALGVRLVVWFGTMLVPIPNEQGLPVSPLLANSVIDLDFYQASRGLYGLWIDQLTAAPVAAWYSISRETLELGGSALLAPPLFAGVLAVFDYGAHNTLPLAFAYLILSCGVVLVWLHWLARHGLGLVGLLVVAAVPGPIWLMLNISTDLPFAALFTAFFLVFFSTRRARQRYPWAAAIAMIATLLRPHGVSLLVFLGIYEAFFSPDRTGPQKVAIAAFLAAAAGVMFWLYGSYYWWYVGTSARLPYFGLTAAEYMGGIYPALPMVVDRPLSWLTLVASKFLYLVGLRPSFAGTEPLLVLIRAAPGLILLPGLLYGLFRAPWAYRLLLATFFAPVVLGSAQDRYVLAVTPLLVFFAARFGQELLAAVRGRRAVFPRLPLERA